MSEQTSTMTQDTKMQVFTTVHYNLQSARATTISESNGRAGIFMSTVSSTLIALGFVGQASNMGIAFSVFALVLFPALIFLGIATFDRVLQSSIEDTIYARGISRIYHYYSEIVPESADYFVQAMYDDRVSLMGSVGIRPSRWQHFLTIAGMVSVVTSIVVGVWAGLLVQFLVAPSLWLVLVVGVAAFVLSAFVHYRAQVVGRRRGTGSIPVRFPGPSTPQDSLANASTHGRFTRR